MKLTKKQIELSEANEKLQYFSHKGIDYWITGINTEFNSCKVKNLTTGEYIRMETTDGSLGDCKLIPLSKIEELRNN